jgi:Pyruvate-formate lyase-activating enzyme
LALRFDGRLINTAEAVEELTADTVFYEITGGGITLSGGEPTLHTDYCLALLCECKRRGLDTAIETCLYTAPENLLKLAPVVDTFYTDIKILDPDKHKQVTGVDNSIILENFRMLAERGNRLVARIPLIPGFTADAENIGRIGRFIAGIDQNIPVELINYNPLAENKYAVFELAYPVKKGTRPYPQKEMDSFKSILKSSGINTVL